MSDKNLITFIDFGSSKIRLGLFNNETSKNIFVLEKKCISNFSLNKFDVDSSKEEIKNLIKSAEKKIDMHINNINLMIDTPNMFSLDISLKKTSDTKDYSDNEIKSLLQEAKNLVEKNYLDQKIVHMIVKKFVFDDNEYFSIPEKKINFNILIIEVKFILFPNQIWKNLQDIFTENYLKIDNLLCSSYVKSVSCSSILNNYQKKIILDIGFSKSAITIFENNRILYFNILPVGGKHITNDIALLLKIDPEKAEILKKSLNKSETTFLENLASVNDKNPPDLANQVIFARVDEIIKLNLTDEYFNAFLKNNDNCALIFIGEGSKILNKNSIYLEDKFEFFKEISFFEQSSEQICETGFMFKKLSDSHEVAFLPRKSKNKGFFEKIFHLFN